MVKFENQIGNRTIGDFRFDWEFPDDIQQMLKKLSPDVYEKRRVRMNELLKKSLAAIIIASADNTSFAALEERLAEFADKELVRA